MSLVTMTSESGVNPFVQTVNLASASVVGHVDDTIDPVGKTWISVRVPYADYLNEVVAQDVFRHPAIQNPGFLNRYVRGLKPEAELSVDDLAVLNGLYNIALVNLPMICRTTVSEIGHTAGNWATLVHSVSVSPIIRHSTYGVGGLGGRYLFSEDDEGIVVHYLEPDRG